jgi:SAM-dependent methyltransferase
LAAPAALPTIGIGSAASIGCWQYLDPPPDTPFPLRYAFYLLGDVRGRTVLDFGCGSGENVAPLLARGARVIGLDLSKDLIELARKRLAITKQDRECRLVVGSAFEVPLPDGAVDAVQQLVESGREIGDRQIETTFVLRSRMGKQAGIVMLGRSL